jgi:prevent-host-death family protein
MTDYMYRRRGRREAGKAVGVRDLKTHAARIIREVRETQAAYVVTHRGQAVGMILPVRPGDDVSAIARDGGAAAAWDRFLAAGRRLERRFRPGISGVRLLSSMRR